MKVLVAVDKNIETFVGLRYACHLLENTDAKVDALHVKPGLTEIAAESYAPFITKDGLEDAIESDVQDVENKFREECRPCVSAAIPCSLQVAEGDAADEILNAAHTDGYDMIVLGSHEQSYLRGLLLGAVHAKILHYANQPVLIVRRFRENWQCAGGIPWFEKRRGRSAICGAPPRSQKSRSHIVACPGDRNQRE